MGFTPKQTVLLSLPKARRDNLYPHHKIQIFGWLERSQNKRTTLEVKGLHNQIDPFDMSLHLESFIFYGSPKNLYVDISVDRLSVAITKLNVFFIL